MSNIYFMCDNCGIETNGITFVNGMKFCAKCYHQIFGKDNQQTEITQLKQQLAEKQNTIDKINKEFVQAVHDWKTLCAEKDKEIESLHETISNKVTSAYGADLMAKSIQFFLEKENHELKQHQTQLAIQELEKLRNDIWELDIGDYYLQNGGILENIKIKRADVLKLIDQQIKELKGE